MTKSKAVDYVYNQDSALVSFERALDEKLARQAYDAIMAMPEAWKSSSTTTLPRGG